MKISHLSPTFCNPMDCGLPGSSVHGILQARILEWVAVPFSRGSFKPRDQIQVCTELNAILQQTKSPHQTQKANKNKGQISSFKLYPN